MPIRPENRDFYRGPAWEALRAAVRTRAANRCERCKAPNGERVFFADGRRDDNLDGIAPWYSETLKRWYTAKGEILDPARLAAMHSLLAYGPDTRWGRYIDVVCGIAHLDHDPSHQDPERCAWLCARCHLAHDRANNYAN